MAFLPDKYCWISVVSVLALLTISSGPSNVDGACNLPSDLYGEWIDSVKGGLYFNQTSNQITAYPFATFGSVVLTCWMANDTVYIFESSEFFYYGLYFKAYFCWNFTQVNTDMFYFYEYGNELPGAGNNERVQAYLPAFSRVYDVMCANPDIGLGTYRILYRNNTLSNSISNCPTELQAHWNYTVANTNSTDLCTDNAVNQLDLCTDPTKFDHNSSECSTSPAYSENGTVNCLFHVYDTYSNIFYLALTQDGGVDNTNTYLITCMIVSFGDSSYLMGTQYPTQCPTTQNDSYVPSPGAYVSFIKTGSCSSEFPWWIVAVSVGSFLFLLALIAFIIWFCCCRESDEEKKKRLMDEDDDERFNPDLFSRGDRPPFVSISIMDGRRSGSAGLYMEDGEDGLGGDDDVDGNGEKGLSDAQKKKEEAQKRRLDKRKRVFMIDKDGQVKKMWKDERESPDSGLEEDQVDGEGKSPDKENLTNEEEEAEFAKKHGRKSLKSAQEIQEKGDRRASSDKTRGKMAGMVSARRSARLRQSARSGPSKLKSERSWGSSNGDFEEVHFQEGDEEVFEPGAATAAGTTAAVAAAAVLSETETKKETKGGKAKTSKGQKDVEKTQTSSKVTESKDEEGGDDAKGDKKGGKKDAKKVAGAAGAAAAAGGILAKKAEVPKAGDKTKKPQVAEKTQGSKLKKPRPDKKEAGQDVAVENEAQVAEQSKEEIVEGMGEEEASKAIEIGEGATDTDDVAAVAAPAAAAAAAVAAGVVAASRVDHKQKDKAELRRQLVEKSQREKEEKIREKKRLRMEKEEKLKKQKEEREAKLKKEREEKKKAPIKKKYVTETTESAPEGPIEPGEKQPEPQAKAAPKEAQVEATANETSGTEKSIKREEVAAIATGAAAPVVLVAAAKGSKKSKEKIKEPQPEHTEQTEPFAEDRDESVEGGGQPEPVGGIIDITAKQPESLSNIHEETGEYETESETTKEDSDSGRDSDKSTVISNDETASSISAPAPAVEEMPLPDGMGMRREQSIMLDLDRTQSQAGEAPLRREKSDLAPGQGERALGAVAEMMETARSQVEGRGVAEEEGDVDERSDESEEMEVETSQHQPDVLPVAAATVVVHPGLKKDKSGQKQPGVKATKDVRSQTTTEKQARGAKPAQVKTISVSEAKSSVVPTTVVATHDEPEDSSSEESEVDEVMPMKKRPKAAGFMFPNENMAAQTFKTTGEVINAKPVRAKKKRRLPRRTSVDFLPDRTNQAFGRKPAAKPGAKPGKVAPLVEAEASQEKKGVPRLLSVKELPAIRASAAPITIKDLTKKPPVPAFQAERSNKLAVGGDAVDGSASPSTRKGRSESSSPARRTPLSSRRISEADSHSQLKLMTRLMSQSEVASEVDPSPRASTGSRRSGKVKSDQLSRHSDPPPPRGMVLEGLEEMDGVLSLTNGSCTPDELTTAREGEVLVGRPPTQHNYRRPSKDGSPKRSRAVSRSHSDSRKGPPPLSHPKDSDENRFVKFREGVLQQLGDMDQQELNRILYPGIKRYPDTPDNLRRGTPAYKSLNALQRIHRKKYRQVAPEPHLELPPIMNAYRGSEVPEEDDPRMRNWLEELYSDKKFFDKSLALPQDDDFIQNRTAEGRDYLLNRARFWSTQQPLVRPGTKMGTRGTPGQVSSDTGGGSTPGAIQNARSKSDDRQRDWRMH